MKDMAPGKSNLDLMTADITDTCPPSSNSACGRWTEKRQSSTSAADRTTAAEGTNTLI